MRCCANLVALLEAFTLKRLFSFCKVFTYFGKALRTLEMTQIAIVFLMAILQGFV